MPARRGPREVKELLLVAPLDVIDAEAELPSRRNAPRAVYRPTIHDLPLGERPRERLRLYGEGALADSELLAIVLRVGIVGENVKEVAERMLRENAGMVGLARLNFDELCGIHGLGEAKAAQLKAAFELGRRLAITVPQERPSIGSPADVARLVQVEMALLEQEQLRVLVLNTRNQVLAIQIVSMGTVNQSQVRPAEVFRPAVRLNAPSIIVVHNHPSGDPTPSRDDVAITRELVSAGRLLDIELLDHVVIGQGRFESLKDRGQGF